jgi:hypothetical protein
MEKKNFTYNCEKCDFHTNAKSMMDKHLVSGKHTTGVRSVRCDKKLLDKCPHCNYKPNSYINMKQHILNLHSEKEDRKKDFKYYCEKCDFGSFIKQTYNKHLESNKHIQLHEL